MTPTKQTEQTSDITKPHSMHQILSSQLL